LWLYEALQAVKNRKRSIAQDGIYSILGLLSYADSIKVDYKRCPEDILREIMVEAARAGYGEALAWRGPGSRKAGQC
jgi:hypothetical protein